MNFSHDKVRIEKKGPITTVIINRPQVHNAIDMETMEALVQAFQEFERDSAARVAVFTGRGDSFCAGADLKEMATGKSVGFAWASEEGLTHRYLSKPVIAAISGHAVAGALGLVTWCDLRVADESAVFGIFCRRFGAPMTNGSNARLPRLIGQSRALDMTLTGRPVGAQEAYEMGLVNRLVPQGKAREAAEELALQLAQFPQHALLSDRECMLHQWELSDKEAMRLDVELGEKAFQLDAQAGAQRFEKGLGRHGEFE